MGLAKRGLTGDSEESRAALSVSSLESILRIAETEWRRGKKKKKERQ